jgi:putative flippase GtrA
MEKRFQPTYVKDVVQNSFFWVGRAMGLKSYIKNVGPQFVRYCIVGGLGSLINLTVLYCLTEFAGLWYMVSAVIAIGTATLWNFYGNRSFTFKVGNEKHPLAVLEKFLIKLLRLNQK